MLRRSAIGLGMMLLLAGTLFFTSTSPRIWPYRNTLQYLLRKQFGTVQLPSDAARGSLQGVVRSTWGRPIAGATVLVSGPDGTAFVGETDAAGRYQIPNVPAGSYIPVAGAPGFADLTLRTWLGVQIASGRATVLDLTLQPRSPTPLVAAADVRLSSPQTWSIQQPLPAQAVRRELSFTVNGRPNQTTLFYTPNDGQTTMLPTLLAVYPGPADQWESVSLPLAQAGYAVIAVGPAYALDLEADVDDLQRVVALAKAGKLPRADGSRIGALAGSYSGLHVMRLAVREPDTLRAVLLLGPPTDMFELRRQFEAGTLFPPFGLDQALIALGLPHQEPERYWRYSSRYHARDMRMPVMLIHSKQDEVVPFTQSQLLADEFKRLGKPHELHILEGMGHYLLATERTPAIDDLFRTTVEFFDQQLAPAP